jgi:hypothetical protein
MKLRAEAGSGLPYMHVYTQTLFGYFGILSNLAPHHPIPNTLKQTSVAYDNSTPYGSEGRSNDSIYSKRIKAGKRRTYFFDVRATRGNDYFITITESKKRFEDGGYDRHKMFLYKEDFNKFLAGLTETINFVKTELMPNFDFDAFNHDNDEEYHAAQASDHNHTIAPQPTEAPVAVLNEPLSMQEQDHNDTVVDEWKM